MIILKVQRYLPHIERLLYLNSNMIILKGSEDFLLRGFYYDLNSNMIILKVHQTNLQFD